MIRRGLLGSLAGATVLLLALGSAAAESAGAHASFLESSPPPGARIAQAPSLVLLEFTEPLNERLSRLRLVEAETGSPVAAAVRVVGGRRLELAPQESLARGAYRMEWRSVSTIDGHVREGSVGFGVRVDARGAAAEMSMGPLDGLGPARVATRWLFYGLLFAFGGALLAGTLMQPRAPLAVWVVPAAARPSGGASRTEPAALAARVSSRVGILGWAALAAAVAVMLVETIDAVGGLSLTGARDFLFSRWAGISRLATVALLLLAVSLARRRPRAAAAVVTLVLLGIALGGHAAGARPRGLAILADWVHLVAGAIWVGGIAQIALTWLPALRRGDAVLRRWVVAAMLPRFGRIALPAFVMVAATGIASALFELGSVDQLWQSAYGRVLAAKTAAVAVIAGLSYAHAFRLRPALLDRRPGQPAREATERAHRRLLGAEPPVAAIVLALAALLVAFPVPPRESSEFSEAMASVRACEPYCPFAQPEPGELPVAGRAGPYTAALWLRREDAFLRATLRVIDGERRPAAVGAEIEVGSPLGSCGPGCWRFRLPTDRRTVRVRLTGEQGRTWRLLLPARWRQADDRRARRILAAAQRRMRALGTFRQVERVSSVASPEQAARTDYAFRAPDRLAYTTPSMRSVIIGRRMWIHPDPRLGWQPAGGGRPPFRVRDGFRWTVFADTARLLRVREESGRRVAELALFDYGYPVWYRLVVDLGDHRVRRATLLTPDNLIEDRYFAFDEPLEIRRPVIG